VPVAVPVADGGAVVGGGAITFDSGVLRYRAADVSTPSVKFGLRVV